MQDTLIVASQNNEISGVPGYKVESITEHQINQINMNQSKKRNSSSSILSAPTSTSSTSSGEEDNIVKKKKKTVSSVSNIEGEEEKPKRTRKNETICTVCEKPGDLLMCDGLCLRSYHINCLGAANIQLTTNPDGSVRWECNDCVNQQNYCFSCKKRGIIGMDLMKCKVHQCGKFYHYKCVSEYKLAKLINTKTPRFNCPLHYCAVCEVSGDGKQSVHCFRCPTAYHVICMQPGVKMLTKSKETRKTGLILCPKHINEPNPNLSNGIYPSYQGNHHYHHNHNHNHQHHHHHHNGQNNPLMNSLGSSGEIYPSSSSSASSVSSLIANNLNNNSNINNNNNINSKIIYNGNNNYSQYNLNNNLNNNISKQLLSSLNNGSVYNNDNINPLYYLMQSSPLSSPTRLTSPPSSPSYTPSYQYSTGYQPSLGYQNNKFIDNANNGGSLFPIKKKFIATSTILNSFVTSNINTNNASNCDDSLDDNVDDFSIISSLASIKEKSLLSKSQSIDNITQQNDNTVDNNLNNKKQFYLEQTKLDESKLVEQFFQFAKSRNFVIPNTANVAVNSSSN